LSQIWFLLSVVPFGATLTVHAFMTFTESQPGSSRAGVALAGLAIGTFAMLVVDYAVRARQRSDGFGVLEQIAIPLLVVVLVATVCFIVVRRCVPRVKVSITGLLIAAAVGVSLPVQTEFLIRSLAVWLGPAPEQLTEGASDDMAAGELEGRASDYVTAGELDGMQWLRSNSDDSDVIVTNVHCRPVRRQFEPCDARGFWVVGMSGRRSVLEGWAYTAEAQKLHGVDGRVWSLQPSPYPRRKQLSDAVFVGDEHALQKLSVEFDARWIVLVHRGSTSTDFSETQTPEFDESVAPIRFENGEVTILEIIDTPTSPVGAEVEAEPSDD